MAHCPIIWKEVDELLTKDTIEKSTGGAGFYPFVLFLIAPVVYNPYIILSNLMALCTYLPSGCLLTDRYGNLFRKMIMLFSIDFKDAYLHIHIINHHYNFLHFVWQKKKKTFIIG